MSHVDSKDDEVKSILAEIDSNDSKESDKLKVKKENKNDDYNEYEENDNDPLIDKSMDDKEW